MGADGRSLRELNTNNCRNRRKHGAGRQGWDTVTRFHCHTRAEDDSLGAHRQVYPKAGKSLLLVILAFQSKSSQRLLLV